jgi:flagellar biosynthetic protein FlhB
LAEQEKTERATPRRRQEIRRRGQVAKSTELTQAFVLLCVVWFIHIYGSFVVRSFHEFSLKTWGEVALDVPAAGDLIAYAAQVAFFIVKLVAPIMAVGFVASMVGGIVQVGFLVSSYPLKPDLNKLNPITGLGRIFSLKGAVELLKSILKVLIVGYLVYGVIRDGYPALVSAADMSLPLVVGTLAGVLWKMGIRVATALFAFAAFDYLYMRWMFEKQIMMTKQEVKQEYKQTEGDPLLRARIRQRMRQLAMRRMMQEVPKADVVITNPEHVAVALKYDSKKMSAPQVVAKGQRLIALRIREIAGDADVPIVQNPELAWSIFNTVEIGGHVPETLYRAVAEVLAYVYQLKRRIPAPVLG